MNRQTFLTRVRQMSDTLSSTVEYPDELLKDFATTVHLDEWRKILGIAPYYQTARRTVTVDANGRFDWADLSTATETAFRLLELTDSASADFQYAQPDRVRLTVATPMPGNLKLWTKNGSEVQTFGASSGETLTALVNYTPTPIGELASDADEFDFPTELRPVLYYEVAALALSKAGRETTEAMDLVRMADMLRQKGLADIARVASTPYVLGADDSAWEWGG